MKLNGLPGLHPCWVDLGLRSVEPICSCTKPRVQTKLYGQRCQEKRVGKPAMSYQTCREPQRTSEPVQLRKSCSKRHPCFPNKHANKTNQWNRIYGNISTIIKIYHAHVRRVWLLCFVNALHWATISPDFVEAQSSPDFSKGWPGQATLFIGWAMMCRTCGCEEESQLLKRSKLGMNSWSFV